MNGKNGFKWNETEMAQAEWEGKMVRGGMRSGKMTHEVSGKWHKLNETENGSSETRSKNKNTQLIWHATTIH